MALTQYPLDGVADGTAITTGNTGASVVSLGTGSTGTYRTAAKAYGTVGVRLVIAAGTSPALRFLFTGGATNNQAAYEFCTSGPNGAASGTIVSVPVVTFRHASGTVASINYDKGNAGLNFKDGASGSILSAITFAAMTTAAGSSVTLATILEYSLVINNSTGVWDLKAYLPGTPTVVWSASGTSTFTSTAPLAGMQYGGSSDVVVTQDVDFVQLNDGLSTPIAQPATNSAPTVTIANAIQTVAAASVVTFVATGADTDGTIASYAWTVEYSSTGSNPTLTNAATDVVSVTAPAAGNLCILRCTITDNLGATGYALAEVRVPTPDSAVRALPGLASGAAGWSIVGTGTDQSTVLADSDGATLVESPDITSTATVRRFRLAPMVVRSTLAITLKGVLLTVTGPTGCKVRLGSGTTQHGEYAVAATTVSQDVTVPPTPGNQQALATAVTDWGNVWYELVGLS
ncbi:MAG: hypothetical protein WC322_02830 [Candidatus Paceibacterota bacterium]|jgi:hypothetical protein